MEIGIFIFPGVEVLDFAAPYEVFSVANRVNRRDKLSSAAFAISVIAETPSPVRTRHGLEVIPSHSIAGHPAPGLLIVPGGDVTQPLKSGSVMKWLQSTRAECEILASICTGAFILAEAGLLRNRRVTTHWEDIGRLRDYPDVRVVEGVRWIDEGAVVTSAGISAGLDMSLFLLQRLAGRELALRTARQMEYSWQE